MSWWSHGGRGGDRSAGPIHYWRAPSYRICHQRPPRQIRVVVEPWREGRRKGGDETEARSDTPPEASSPPDRKAREGAGATAA